MATVGIQQAGTADGNVAYAYFRTHPTPTFSFESVLTMSSKSNTISEQVEVVGATEPEPGVIAVTPAYTIRINRGSRKSKEEDDRLALAAASATPGSVPVSGAEARAQRNSRKKKDKSKPDATNVDPEPAESNTDFRDDTTGGKQAPTRSYLRNELQNKAPSAELALAAEVVPDNADLEAQFEKKLGEQASEIKRQLKQELINDAVTAQVVDQGMPVQQGRRTRCTMLIGVVILIATAIGVALGLVFSKKDEPVPTEPDGTSLISTIDPAPNPTKSPTTSNSPNSPFICELCPGGASPPDLNAWSLFGNPPITCGDLVSLLATNGCEAQQAAIQLNSAQCNCPAVETGTCTLCSDGSEPQNPNASANTNAAGATCGELAEGVLALYTPELCETERVALDAKGFNCGCPNAAESVCTLCGAGQEVPDPTLLALEDQGSCGDVAAVISTMTPSECISQEESIKVNAYACRCPGATRTCWLCQDGSSSPPNPDQSALGNNGSCGDLDALLLTFKAVDCEANSAGIILNAIECGC